MSLSTAPFSDAIGALRGRPERWSHASTECRLAAGTGPASGPAYTISIAAAPDTSLEHRRRYFEAFDAVPSGAVVVVSVAPDVLGAVVGDVMATAMSVRGAAGVVTDGAVRDTAAIEAVGLSVWARTRTMHSVASDQILVKAGQTIELDHVQIAPGDLIVADRDGVIAIPASWSTDVTTWVEERERSEVDTLAAVRRGEPLADVYHVE